jgi:putative toxin-antitoxin system antitoxin component (TIGR02293 family)
MTAQAVAEMLGGGRVFVGRVISSDLDLVEAARKGFPTSAVDALIDAGALSSQEVDQMVMLRDDLEARRQSNEPLTTEESDRLIRFARIAALANETFGEQDRAARWLRKPNRGLGGAVPIELLSTGEGARIVEESLIQIAHGIFP